MMKGEKDPALAAMRQMLPTGMPEFVDFCGEKLWPESYKAARKMGLTESEAKECAIRVVRAVTQQMGAAFKRGHMRDAMPPRRKS